MARAPLSALLLLAVACNGTSPKASTSSVPESRAAREATAAARAPADAGAAAAPTGVRVATYNVNFGMAGDAETIELIRGLGADVVFLQEINQKWARAIRRELGDAFPHMKFRDHSWPAGGQAVLSRLPLGDEIWKQARDGHFPVWRVVIESPLGALQVLSVHLDPPSLRAKHNGWLAAYQDSQEVHVRELTAHLRHLAPAVPALVVGDFNEDVNGKAIAWLRERGFVPAIDEFVPTWEWRTRGGTVRWQLDHVLYGPGLRVLDAAVVDGGNSDHQPVVVTIAAAEPAE